MGLYTRILVPTEGTDSDLPALRHVRQLAEVHGAEVVLLRVAHYHTRDERTHEVDDAEEDLRRAAAVVAGGGFPVRTELRHGEPAETIIAAAHELGADLIVMGTHGHGWLPRLVLGSVAEDVRHGADVPLLLVRADIKQDAGPEAGEGKGKPPSAGPEPDGGPDIG
jgi:nucleotide-binding universal stress UspA family protein